VYKIQIRLKYFAIKL